MILKVLGHGSENPVGHDSEKPLKNVGHDSGESHAFGAEVGYSSLVGYFDLEEVRRISALDKKGEFFVVVIGTTGEEKKFKVKSKHFEELP